MPPGLIPQPPEIEPLHTEAEMIENGYQESVSEECVVCNVPYWFKTTHKPFRWQSDVMVTTFYFLCRWCGNSFTERDSD